MSDCVVKVKVTHFLFSFLLYRTLSTFKLVPRSLMMGSLMSMSTVEADMNKLQEDIMNKGKLLLVCIMKQILKEYK